MTHRALWELACCSLDAVLWTSFSWEELQLIADSMGFELECPPVEDPAARVGAVMTGVHRACHAANPFSDRISHLLDELHEDAIQLLRETPIEVMCGWCTTAPEKLPLSLAGFFWAVARDARCELRRVEEGLLWKIQVEGLRALAFGKIEVIHV